MDIFRIGAGGSTPVENGKTGRPVGTRSDARTGVSASIPASDAPSGGSVVVDRFVARLAASDDVRADVVERFKALLSMGELDTPAAFDRAASAMLER